MRRNTLAPKRKDCSGTTRYRRCIRYSMPWPKYGHGKVRRAEGEGQSVGDL